MNEVESRIKLRAGLVWALALILWGIVGVESAWAADVVLGGKVVFRISEEEKAQELSQRLETLLQEGREAKGIKIVRQAPGESSPEGTKKRIFIYWDKEQIIEVTPAIAKQNSSTPEALAKLWVENMRNVVAIGLLNVDADRLVFAVGNERTLNVTGLAQGDLEAVDSAGIVDITIDPESGRITLRGLRAGKSSLIISKGQAQLAVFLQVKDWAGQLPLGVQVEVTGDPAQSAAILQAVMLSIASNTSVQPGCSVYVEDMDLQPQPVGKGESMRLSIPVGITATDDYYPVRGNVGVLVKNIEVPAVEQNLLLVSNRPERVDQDGVLLKYNFKASEPTRLMFSHLNASAERRYLWVNLFNLNPEPLKIVISRTSAGPERSEIYVGQTAAKRFLENLAARSGYVITLPPNSALELCSYDMAHMALVSGFINFQILEGESATVEVRTSLDPQANDGRALPDLGAPFNPFKIHPHGVFAQPYFEYEGDFTVGGSPLTFRYGESPWLIDFETGLPNTGNFGVLYKYLVEFKNPTRATKTVGLYFTPLKGPGGAHFLMGHKVYQAAFRRKGERSLVAKIELPPESDHLIEIITLPEATSSYPAQFELVELDGK